MAALDVMNNIRLGKMDLLDHLAELCDRIASADPKIQALVPGTFERERVLDDAARLVAQYPEPASRPPLFGLPVGVKDIFRVWGFPTRCGSELPEDLFEGTEATCVSKLKSAGAIIVGKTVTTEFAYFQPGPTRNPHNMEHTPGGSSSGSAAGVASRFFPLALGTQTVGSVIRPAAFCGIVGFKPSFGRISMSGIIPFSRSADHVGILCDDPTGVDLFMSVMAEDWLFQGRGKMPNRIVLGVPEGPYLQQATENGLDFFEMQLTKLLEAGFKINRFNVFSNIKTVNENHNNMIAAEMARVHADWFRRYGHLYQPKSVEIIQKGLAISDEHLETLCLKQREFRHKLGRFMESEGIDFWICPSSTDHAPKGLDTTGDPIMNLPWTHAGLPVMSLPTGVDGDGLPQGIQICARFMMDEGLVLLSKDLYESLSEGKESV
jgi:Asp-tRNA(Asn)/Glu-tRNA(Gln) amidotransferase A subunit family amidase